MRAWIQSREPGMRVENGKFVFLDDEERGATPHSWQLRFSRPGPDRKARPGTDRRFLGDFHLREPWQVEWLASNLQTAMDRFQFLSSELPRDVITKERLEGRGEWALGQTSDV